VRNMAAKHLFHACKFLSHAVNLRHGTDGFTSPPKERRAADFITLKIHRPWPGLNPRTLGPVASTLTTRPPRATYNNNTHYLLSVHHQKCCPSKCACPNMYLTTIHVQSTQLWSAPGVTKTMEPCPNKTVDIFYWIAD
jgi:hypothetical protein